MERRVRTSDRWAAFIKEKRGRRSQAAFAAPFSSGGSYVSAWEKYGKIPSRQMVIDAATAYGEDPTPWLAAAGYETDSVSESELVPVAAVADQQRAYRSGGGGSVVPELGAFARDRLRFFEMSSEAVATAAGLPLAVVESVQRGNVPAPEVLEVIAAALGQQGDSASTWLQVAGYPPRTDGSGEAWIFEFAGEGDHGESGTTNLIGTSGDLQCIALPVVGALGEGGLIMAKTGGLKETVEVLALEGTVIPDYLVRVAGRAMGPWLPGTLLAFARVSVEDLEPGDMIEMDTADGRRYLRYVGTDGETVIGEQIVIVGEAPRWSGETINGALFGAVTFTALATRLRARSS